jgi:hypothetical protein
MSGASNVLFWLQKNGYQGTEEEVSTILQFAKQTNKVLSHAELQSCLGK